MSAAAGLAASCPTTLSFFPATFLTLLLSPLPSSHTCPSPPYKRAPALFTASLSRPHVDRGVYTPKQHRRNSPQPGEVLMDGQGGRSRSAPHGPQTKFLLNIIGHLW